ncbi:MULTISPECIES: hypothetical protein [Rhizobium]|uniref:Uncharacterized protein n=1 Tax=Rhizobium indicum TaxID=2583231 RepID=A0ABX6PK90_9HYPH|nr:MULTISPECIES: hypothetical protein [Rhizobium]MBA1345962.1 hypothetical protein [Rhizobium sp. WYCCWR 11146]NYT28893.1 hypothetical protein [Rhizobium sp. WYCCWR 11128]QKK18630.1 hypothetical protein FFM53_020180 [Rhizobium indicum]
MAVALSVWGGEAAADMDLNGQELAGGLVQIIAYADPCAYDIDQNAQFIGTSVPLMAKSNASLRTITKATAKSLGLLR